MLISYEANNHVRPTYAGRLVSEGQTERIELRGAWVFCDNSGSTGGVILTLDTRVPDHPRRTVTARIERPPSALRKALEGAIETGQARVLFIIVDGERLIVDGEVFLRSYDSEGPVTLAFEADRAAIPWPAKPTSPA